MTLTLHTQNKMAGSINNLYLFGEDFEAILDILEGDEDLEKQFESSVSDVSTNSEDLYFCFGWSIVKRERVERELVCYVNNLQFVYSRFLFICVSVSIVGSVDNHCMQRLWEKIQVQWRLP